MHSTHELTTRRPALDVAATRARLDNSPRRSPALPEAVGRSTAFAGRAAALQNPSGGHTTTTLS